MQFLQNTTDTWAAAVPVPPLARTAWEAYVGAVGEIARAAFIIQFTDFIGAARVCAWYRINVRRPVSWHQSLIVVLIVHFGGTTLTGLMTGKSPSWAGAHEPLFGVLLTWYLTFFCPLDLWWRFYNIPIVNRACVLVESISMANGIGNLGVGKVLERSRGKFAHPGMLPSPVLGFVCGVVSGCGGGLFSEFSNFLDDPTPHSRRPQKAHRRRFVRALVGATIIFLSAWPRSGRLEDFNECDTEGPIALVALLLALDGLGIAPRAMSAPVSLLAWMVPGFRSVFVPNLSNLANGPEAVWGKLRERARRMLKAAGVRVDSSGRQRLGRRRAGSAGGDAGRARALPQSLARGDSGGRTPLPDSSPAAAGRATPLVLRSPPSLVRELAADRLASDAVLMPFARDRAVPREVLARHRVDLAAQGVDETQALAYIGVVLGCSRGRASKLLERQAAEAAQSAIEAGKRETALKHVPPDEHDEPIDGNQESSEDEEGDEDDNEGKPAASDDDAASVPGSPDVPDAAPATPGRTDDSQAGPAASVLLALAVIVLLGLAWQTFRAPSVGSTAITEAPPSTLDPEGKPGTLEYSLFFRDTATGSRISPWHSIALKPAHPHSSTEFTFVCEIPRGATAKMEINKETKFNPIKQDTKKGKLRSYHSPSLVNYGAFPQTWEDPDHEEDGLGGDNDPLDVVDVGSKPCQVGDVYTVRVLGVLGMVDGGEMDWKVVVARSGAADAAWVDASAPTEEQGARLAAMRDWFRDYKLPDGKPENEFAFEGRFLGPDEAVRIVGVQHELYKKLASVGPDVRFGMWVGAASRSEAA